VEQTALRSYTRRRLLARFFTLKGVVILASMTVLHPQLQ